MCISMGRRKKDLSSSRTFTWSCLYLVGILSSTSLVIFAIYSSSVFLDSCSLRCIHLSIPTCHSPFITCAYPCRSSQHPCLWKALMAAFQFLLILPRKAWSPPISIWFTNAAMVSYPTTSISEGIGPTHLSGSKLSHCCRPSLNFCVVYWHELPLSCKTFSTKCVTRKFDLIPQLGIGVRGSRPHLAVCTESTCYQLYCCIWSDD